MIFQAGQKIEIRKFLELAEYIPVVDVRSPTEYSEGHIPGACNIPLFDDREREAVGTAYSKRGRTEAVLEGLRLSGSQLYSKLEAALRIAKDNKLLVHCWRGGMRSESMAWLFSAGGIDCEVLEGGYKSYRHHILKSVAEKRPMIILGGLTGSGKTKILLHLKEHGHQVIDLEGIAKHKGSAFGSLGQESQPTSGHFANLLYDEWRKSDRDKLLWLEDESHNIGTVFMPREFYLNMQNNPVIVLIMDVKTRIPRLMEEYSKFPADDLVKSIGKITRRIGGDSAEEAIRAIGDGDLVHAIEIVLKYYDKAYLYGIRKKQSENIVYVSTDTDDIRVNSLKILEAAGSIPGLRDYF